MWVSLKKPYKIIAHKEKRYAEHYNIPAASCLIVPRTRREDEILCDVHWRENGGVHIMNDIMFDSENLELVTSAVDGDLFELWCSFNPLYKPAKEPALLKLERSILSRQGRK